MFDLDGQKMGGIQLANASRRAAMPLTPAEQRWYELSTCWFVTARHTAFSRRIPLVMSTLSSDGQVMRVSRLLLPSPPPSVAAAAIYSSA